MLNSFLLFTACAAVAQSACPPLELVYGTISKMSKWSAMLIYSNSTRNNRSTSEWRNRTSMGSSREQKSRQRIWGSRPLSIDEYHGFNSRGRGISSSLSCMFLFLEENGWSRLIGLGFLQRLHIWRSRNKRYANPPWSSRKGMSKYQVRSRWPFTRRFRRRSNNRETAARSERQDSRSNYVRVRLSSPLSISSVLMISKESLVYRKTRSHRPLQILLLRQRRSMR